MIDVKFGDVWRIGQHKLLCGDSTAKPMVDHFLAGARPRVCITDPPYGIHYRSRRTNDGLYQLKVKNDHAISWGDAFRFSNAPVLYVWFSFKHYDVASRAIRDAGYEIKQMVVWKKHQFSLQHHLYHLQHEQCLVCIKQGIPAKDLWTGDRKQVSVWEVPSVKPKDRIHPTEKPIGVYTIPIRNHTSEGEIVLDLFAGSGAIFSAAEATGRIGLGVELDPVGCSRILTRMEQRAYSISLERNIFDTE